MRGGSERKKFVWQKYDRGGGRESEIFVWRNIGMAPIEKKNVFYVQQTQICFRLWRNKGGMGS